jgi:hypothetical protein
MEWRPKPLTPPGAGAAAAAVEEPPIACMARTSERCVCGSRKTAGYWFCKSCWGCLPPAIQWGLMQAGESVAAFGKALEVLAL